MVKRLIIAEKREQAEKYAQALGRSKRVDYSYHVKPDLHIAFCRGHLLNIINNAKEAYQSRENLPFFPETIEYGFKPNGKTKSEKAADLKSLKAYFKNIQKEIEWADEIIVGTDSDREGESIFYTLLNQFPKAKAKIKWRLWANSLTKDGVRKAYDHLKPAEDTYSLYIAADARRIADWLFGVANGSPLVLMDLKDKGVILDKKEKLTVGRIKCPMMKLVIDNNEAIKNHVSKPFWKLEAKDQHEVIFRQKVIYGGEDNNLTQADAQKAFEKTQSFARVVKVEHDEVIQTAPKLFNLNGLQDYCSKKHHLSANQTLEIVKELRSDGYLSYPRTDCTFITEYEFAYLKNNVKAYQKLLETPFELVNMEPRKKYVNSKKVKEHYALIPTEELPDLEKLSSHHRLIYEIVTKRTLMMFAQDKKIAKTNDPDFVVGQLNLAKHHFNEEISKRDEQVTQIQQAILNKKISILENIETQGLNAQIKVKDRRAALKNSLLKQEKESVDQKLDVLTQEVTKEKELKLSDAKQSYEHQIQLIELEASKNLRTKKEALEERSRREIQDKIRQAIEQETAELMRFIQEQKRLIEQKIRSEKEKIEAQFQEVIGKQDHELQAYYLYLLEQKKRTFENEAKEALAQLKQSESKSESAETLAFKQQIVDLKAQVKEMSQKIQDLKSPVIAQEEPLEATSEVTSKEADKTTGEKMSKRTLETTLENTPETTLESNQSRLILKRIGWLMLILLAICITAYGLGSVGVKLFSH